MTPGDEGYEVAKKGVQAFIAELVAPKREGEKVDKAFVDALIAEIDVKLSRQIDEIIHNTTFQKLESAWRGLKFVVDRTDFRENVKIELLNCSKEDLLADFEDSPEVPKSGLYKLVYSAEFGTFGGKPVGAIVSNYEFGPGPRTSPFSRSAPPSRRWPTRPSSRPPARSSSASRTTSTCPT